MLSICILPGRTGVIAVVFMTVTFSASRNDTHLHEADIELLGGVSSRQVASDVDVVVTDDAGNHVCR